MGVPSDEWYGSWTGRTAERETDTDQCGNGQTNTHTSTQTNKHTCTQVETNKQTKKQKQKGRQRDKQTNRPRDKQNRLTDPAPDTPQ